MPEKSKTYEKSALRVYIRTFGWPMVAVWDDYRKNSGGVGKAGVID